MGEVSAGILHANALCFVFIRFIHSAFLALPKTGNWSKKLPRIYLGKDREHSLMGGEMHGEVLRETTSSIKTAFKELIFTPWF